MGQAKSNAERASLSVNGINGATSGATSLIRNECFVIVVSIVVTHRDCLSLKERREIAIAPFRTYSTPGCFFYPGGSVVEVTVQPHSPTLRPQSTFVTDLDISTALPVAIFLSFEPLI